MTERDFVLNNINKYEGVFSKEELNVHLKYVKDLYKTICENTSEESDTIYAKPNHILIDKDDLVYMFNQSVKEENFRDFKLEGDIKNKYLKMNIRGIYCLKESD